MKKLFSKATLFLIFALCHGDVLANVSRVNTWGQRFQQQTSQVGASIVTGTLCVAGIMFAFGNQLGATIAKYAVIGGVLIFGGQALVGIIQGIFK